MPSQAQSPINSPQTVSFAHPIASRDGTLTKDSKMVNCFMESTENGMALVKRPGTIAMNGGLGTAQGTFNCNGESYFISNDTIIRMSDSMQFPIPSVTVAGEVFETLDDVPFATTWLKSPHGLWQVADPGTGLLVQVKVTDVNYPAETVPGICYLDGIYYVMNTKGEVLGSALQDGSTWPALNFIEADQSLGQGAGLFRHLNYLVAYYTAGIQMYYDANAVQGQVDTGTQLGPVGNAAWTTGLASGWSVVEMTDLSYFLAQDKKRGRTIMQINGLEMMVVSTPYIEKALNRSSLTNVNSFGIRTAGHSFYVLTLVDLNLTLVYDVAANQWFQWSTLSGTTDMYFVGCNYLNANNNDYLQDARSGTVMRMDPAVYQDSSGPIKVVAITPLYDYGTMNWKRVADHSFFGDTLDTSVQISFTHDDYQTWSTPRSLSMNTTWKRLVRCGRFRRRAYMMVHQDNTPLRLVDSKLDLTVESS